MSDQRSSRFRHLSDGAYLQNPNPSKRQRTSASIEPDLWNDCDMTEVEESRNTFSSISILHLPPSCLSRIMTHVTSQDPKNPMSHSSISPQTVLLARSYYIRETCRALRAAYDAHVTAFDFSGLQITCIEILLRRVLLRFRSLSSLSLTPASTDQVLVQSWTEFFTWAQALGIRIRNLNFVDSATLTTTPDIIVAGCGAYLERIHIATSHSISSASILSSITQHCPTVRSVDVLLDNVDSRILAGLSGLRVLRALFRRGMSRSDMDMLIWALSNCAKTLQSVELRVHRLEDQYEALSLLPNLPRLRKLSLFSCQSSRSLVGWIAGCVYLHELQLEWLDDLSDGEIEELSRLIGHRLLRVRIWNCMALTDTALFALAHACPGAEVELRFKRGQFSEPAIAALPHVQWEALDGTVLVR